MLQLSYLRINEDTWQWYPRWSKNICNVKDEIFKLPWKALQKQSSIYSILSRFPYDFPEWDLSLSDVLKHFSLDIYSFQIQFYQQQGFTALCFLQGDKLGEKKLIYILFTSI